MHRFTWDVHYQPLDSAAAALGGPNLPIAAIGHNTVPAPTTPWVNPGTYTVKLTVNGKTYSQPIVVKQDPRVKTPALAMQQVYTLSKAAYYGALDAQDGGAAGAARPRSDRDAASRRRRARSRRRSTAFDKKLEALASTPPAAGVAAAGAAAAAAAVARRRRARLLIRSTARARRSPA